MLILNGFASSLFFELYVSEGPGGGLEANCNEMSLSISILLKIGDTYNLFLFVADSFMDIDY
jgi:hypothetical protein